MEELIDPTEDITDVYVIRRSNQLELDRISQWLSELDESQESKKIREILSELYGLCLLRNRLLLKIKDDETVILGPRAA